MSETTTRDEEGAKLPSEADFLRETIKVVEWQRDEARRHRNAAEARAASAEAEVERLKGLVENWKATAEAEAEIGNERAATAQALRDRVAVLESALKPFAAITPSSFYTADGSEAERYVVVLAGRAEDAEFLGSDLAAARAALNGGNHV